MMNRICFDAVTRKKSRLEALAQSRERTLGSETDSDDEQFVSKKSKAKMSRKMTRSLPGKTCSLSTAAGAGTAPSTNGHGLGLDKKKAAMVTAHDANSNNAGN